MIQSLNDSIAHLPLPRLHQLADLALDQVALQCADVADVELAMQMFGFMKEGSGKQFFAFFGGFLVPLSIYILGTNRYLAWPGHGFTKFRNAEAPLRLSVFALGVEDLRIRQH